MSRTLTAADRSALIRLASTLPSGSDDRRAILKGLVKSAGEIIPDDLFYDVKDLAREEAATLWGYDSGHRYSPPDQSEYGRANRELVNLLQKIQRDYGEDGLDEALDAVASVQYDLKQDAYKRQGRNLPDPKRPRWASTLPAGSPERKAILKGLSKTKVGSGFRDWASSVHQVIGSSLSGVQMEGRGHDNSGVYEKARASRLAGESADSRDDFYEGYIDLWDLDGDKYRLRYTALTDFPTGDYSISLSGNTGMSGQDQIQVKGINPATQPKAVWRMLLREMSGAPERNRINLWSRANGRSKFWVL